MAQLSDPPEGVEPAPRRSRWTVVAPALTLVVGILLGVAIAGAGNVGRSGNAAAPAASPRASAASTPTPSPTGSDLVVRVPAACLDLANRTSRALASLGAAASAARNFDARTLAQALTELQDQQGVISDLADRCRSAAGNSVAGGSLVSPAASGG